MDSYTRLTAVLFLVAVSACAPRQAADAVPETAPACVLRVGTSGDYAPFSLVASDGFDGMDVEIARRLGDDLGCRIELLQFAWPQLMPRLERGDFDLAVSGITMRSERALRGVFSRPYARTGVVVMVAPASSLRTLPDLDRPSVRIAVNSGGHLERWARQHLQRADLRPTADNRSLGGLLAEQQVDAIVTDDAEARSWAEIGRRLGPFSTDYKAILGAMRHSALVTEVDSWLADREADGWLATVRARHLGDRQVDDARAATVQAVAALARLRLSLMPMVAAAKLASGAPLADAAQERRVIERARSWSAEPGTPIEAVFTALIDLAKRIQERHAANTTASIDQLRAAIGNIDRQLVRELDRVQRLPAVDAEQWAIALRPVVEDLPLRAGELDDLSAALEMTGTSSRKQTLYPLPRPDLEGKPGGSAWQPVEKQAPAAGGLFSSALRCRILNKSPETLLPVRRLDPTKTTRPRYAACSSTDC